MRVMNLPDAVELPPGEYHAPPRRLANILPGRIRARLVGLDEEVRRRVARGRDGEDVHVPAVPVRRMHVTDVDELVRMQNCHDGVDVVQLPIVERSTAK